MKLRLIISLGALSFWGATAQATVIDKTLTIQVYQLCNDNGLNCASLGPNGNSYFATEVNAIWAQAGIQVLFNFVQKINSTAFSALNDNVNGDGFIDLAFAHGGPGYTSNTVVDMYLVHTIFNNFGEGFIGSGGIAIAMDTVMGYSAAGRFDTIAHELGHNLGLLPNTYANSDGTGHSTATNQLMAAGTGRLVPTSVANIAPNGLGYDYLPPDQIALARQSSLLQSIVATPEPATTALIGVGLLLAGISRRRKTHR